MWRARKGGGVRGRGGTCKGQGGKEGRGIEEWEGRKKKGRRRRRRRKKKDEEEGEEEEGRGGGGGGRGSAGVEKTKGRRDELKGWGQQGAGVKLTRRSTRP